MSLEFREVVRAREINWEASVYRWYLRPWDQVRVSRKLA